MKHLVDKDDIVAEIERRIKTLNERLIKRPISSPTLEKLIEENKKVLFFLNTLEVKEVDLEKELSDLDKDIKEFVTTEEFENESTTAGHYWVIAKHAFLLGLKAQKGE